MGGMRYHEQIRFARETHRMEKSRLWDLSLSNAISKTFFTNVSRKGREAYLVIGHAYGDGQQFDCHIA